MSNSRKTPLSASIPDQRLARRLHDRGIPLHLVEASSMAHLKHDGVLAIVCRMFFIKIFRTESIEQGLIDIVQRGGDTDTNAVLAGALKKGPPT
jgi:hypothetical protein